MPVLGQAAQERVGIEDRRRHQLRRLVGGVAEHDALVAGTLVLVLAGIDAPGDVGRLLVQQHLDLGVLPVKAGLRVADGLDRLARRVLDQLVGDLAVRAGPHLAGDDHPIGGGQSLAGDARLGYSPR